MYDEEIGANDAQKISKINSAGLINLRLHNLWVDVNNHSRKGMFSLWNGDLDRLWCEMAADVIPTTKGDKEDDETLRIFDTIKEKIKKLSPITNWKSSDGFKHLDDTQKSTKQIQYEMLMEKEIFLRRLQNKQGKGTAYIEEDDDWE